MTIKFGGSDQPLKSMEGIDMTWVVDTEPFFIKISNVPKCPEQRLAWISARADEARALGSTFMRATYLVDTNDTLIECWKERPEDQGNPRVAQAERID